MPDRTFPVWIANFVLMDYGTGAIFGCPAHDQRDMDFARKYGLEVTPVVAPPGEIAADTAYTGPGKLINSGFLDGLESEAGKRRAIERLEADGAGEGVVNWRLRDWGISRQRYWGAPIPIIHCATCGPVPVPESDLPVVLPLDVTFDRPGNPLDHHPTWKHVACPRCGAPATRETDTMDTFVDSSWYFARFCSPACAGRAGSARGRSLVAGRSICRRHRACDPAPPLCAVLHQGPASNRRSRRRGAVRRAVHAGHGDARDLSRRRWRVAVSGRDRVARRRDSAAAVRTARPSRSAAARRCPRAR